MTEKFVIYQIAVLPQNLQMFASFKVVINPEKRNLHRVIDPFRSSFPGPVGFSKHGTQVIANVW